LTDACIASDSTAKTNLDENPRAMFKLGVLTAVVNVWYLSFHGGTERNSRNNIHIYSAAGEELGKALNRKSLPDNIELRELRGFGFGPDRHLYVVNAYREASQILRFTGKTNPDGQHDFLDVFVAHHHERNPQLVHPFNFAFSTEAICTSPIKIPLVYHATMGLTLSTLVCRCHYRTQSGKSANTLPAFSFPR
jgi:hypothetical protein